MSPLIDEFSEDFADYPITWTIDYSSDYNQIPLDKQSCDLTTFMMNIDLIRSTCLS